MQVYSTSHFGHSTASVAQSTHSNLRFKGSAGFYDTGAGWGTRLFAPVTARISEFQMGANVAGYTEKLA